MTQKFKASTLLLLFLLPLFGHAQIKLEKRSILEGKVELMVPDYFKPMSSYGIIQKYPNANQQPNLVLTDDKGDVNIVVALTPQPVRPEQMADYKAFMIQNLKRSHPNAQWGDNGVKTINGKKVGYFKMTNSAVDQKVFVFYFFTDLDGKALLFTFNCPLALLPKWKDTADQVMASLKVK